MLERIREAARSGQPEEILTLVDAIGSSTLDDLVADLRPALGTLAQQLERPLPRFVAVESSHQAPAQVRFRAEIVPALRDVFMHLLRNALDHGIEPVEERRVRGKPDAGKVTLSVRSNGHGCELRVHDDGRGLSVAALRAQAAARALPCESDEELAQLAFQSGISTADASRISGRGVGLDAVRVLMAERGGKVDLELESATDEDRRPFTAAIWLPERWIVRLRTPAEVGTA
ncbi:MAG: ATP-binding protein [Myxococcales bacterium]